MRYYISIESRNLLFPKWPSSANLRYVVVVDDDDDDDAFVVVV
jgi:hypothetical protein